MPCTQALLILSVYIGINAVPPEACFAKFRWDDCGRPPVRVLYYWKPGSRCEVGVWRGCLPNLNMFHDEYECVATCIFTARAEPADYHALAGVEQLDNATLSDTEKLDDEEVTAKSDDVETSPNPTGKDDDTKDDTKDNTKDDTNDITGDANKATSSASSNTKSKPNSGTDAPGSMNQ